MIGLNKLPTNTKSLFLALVSNNQDGILDDFLLIGGTALSMQIDHRLSEDIDFAIGTQKLPRRKIVEILKRLEAAGQEIIDFTSEAARDDFTNDGLEVEDYQQDWLVSGTKLTFFTYGNNAYENKIIAESPFDMFKGIKVASLGTIAKTKCHALTKRMKSRDLFDIYHLINAGHLSMEEVIAEMQRSSPHMTFETCTHRILEKPMQADDEGLTPIDIDISVDKIREFLTTKVEELELNISTRMLQQYNAPSDA